MLVGALNGLGGLGVCETELPELLINSLARRAAVSKTSRSFRGLNLDVESLGITKMTDSSHSLSLQGEGGVMVAFRTQSASAAGQRHRTSAPPRIAKISPSNYLLRLAEDDHSRAPLHFFGTAGNGSVSPDLFAFGSYIPGFRFLSGSEVR